MLLEAVLGSVDWGCDCDNVFVLDSPSISCAESSVPSGGN